MGVSADISLVSGLPARYSQSGILAEVQCEDTSLPRMSTTFFRAYTSQILWRYRASSVGKESWCYVVFWVEDVSSFLPCFSVAFLV